MTGGITGTVPQQTSSITDFTTTITATDMYGSDSQTFAWHVLSGNTPVVLFAINDTLRTDDDVTLLEPQPLPLSVRVMLYAPGTMGSQQVSLDVPSGLSSVSPSLLYLSDGGSAEVTLTPLQV